MKVIEAPTKIARIGKFEESEFGIKTENLPIIFDILRNKMYSDKPRAVIREYSTNATDAHKEAGKGDRPIEVTLPSTHSLMLEIRDFGLGLNEEEIRETYVMYASSTKRNSNDLIGQLGLGSKAAFAYTDSFMITSYQKGRAATYRAYINETKVGAIAKMADVPTTEEDGIRIVVPIKATDLQTFKYSAEQVFKYFKVRPIIKGRTDVLIEVIKYDHKGNGWGLTTSSTMPYAIMGDIGYPLDSNALSTHSSNGQKALLAAGIHIDFGIGDLDISSTRESLEYSKHTIKNILARLDSALVEVTTSVESSIKTAKNIIEAKKIASQLVNGSLGRLKNVLSNAIITWKGKNLMTGGNYGGVDVNITNKFRSGEEVKILRVWENSTNQSGRPSTTEEYTYRINHNTDIVFYEDDVNGDRWLVRSGQILKAQKGTQDIDTLILKFKDATCKKKFIDDQMLEEVEILKLSSIIPAKSIRTPSQKNQKEVFSFKRKSAKSHGGYYYGPFSQYWTSSKVDVTNPKAYLPISNFKPFFGTTLRSLGDLDTILDTFDKYQIKIDDIEWYGIKEADVKYAKKWQDFRTLVIDRAIDFLKKNHPDALSSHYDANLNDKVSVNSFDVKMRISVGLTDIQTLDKNSLFRTYIERLHELTKGDGKNQDLKPLIDVLNLMGFDINQYKNALNPNKANTIASIEQMRNDVFSRYPMFEFLEQYNINKPKFRLCLLEYVSQRDQGVVVNGKKQSNSGSN